MYTPTGPYSTKHLVRLLLAELPIVQTLLGVASTAEALVKIATYGHIHLTDDGVPLVVSDLAFPRILIQNMASESDVSSEGNVLDIAEREIAVLVWFYVEPNVDIENLSDEDGWVRDQFGAIETGIRSLQGTGQPNVGIEQTHVCVQRITFMGCDAAPDDERMGTDIDPSPEKSLWSGLIELGVG